MTKGADLAPSFDDIGLVSRTVWGEARGESPEGWAAVAWVIKNRANHPGWWGRSVREVCLRPQQFSSWNIGDPNREKMIDLPDDDHELLAIRDVVEKVWSGEIADPTGGATFYHTQGCHPSWDTDMKMTATIGRHEFFTEVA